MGHLLRRFLIIYGLLNLLRCKYVANNLFAMNLLQRVTKQKLIERNVTRQQTPFAPKTSNT